MEWVSYYAKRLLVPREFSWVAYDLSFSLKADNRTYRVDHDVALLKSLVRRGLKTDLLCHEVFGGSLVMRASHTAKMNQSK